MNPINNYILPHLLNRKDQAETADEILKWVADKSRSKHLIIDAPTGSGKSAWVANTSRFYKTMVLTETKVLQSQYQTEYGLTVSYGRGNYECDEVSVSAEQCPLSQCNHNCEYAKSRRDAIASDQLSVNYTKYTLDHRLATQHQTQVLFSDEAHQLPNITMDNSGLSIPWEHRFIQMAPRIIPAGSMAVSRSNGIAALKEMIKQIDANEVNWNEGIEPKSKDRLTWERMGMRLKTVLKYIISASNPQSWFFDGEDGKNLIIKPLTAMYNYPKMFNSADKIVLISATIGNAEVLARRLGINNDYEFISIEGEFTPDMRPVYDLGGPKLSFKSPESDYINQANIINNPLLRLPEWYTGILHTKSKKHAYTLKNILNEMDNPSKYWFTIPDNIKGTENQLTWWNDNRESGTGLIHWAFWEGVSLPDDNFSIVCKTPFPYTGDPYGKAQLAYDRDGYRQSTACDIEQACGRVRRGFIDHYGPNAAKFVAIADGNYSRVMSSYSNSFRNSIVKYDADNMPMPDAMPDTVEIDGMEFEIPF